jgi:two-component system, cell cycle response regulator DivK
MSAKLVLIIEDNEKNRKLERDVLQYKGYATVETGNAEDGIRMARERLPDLILMDIQLPGIDGVEALGRLRGDPATREIPVIAVTASAMKQDRDRIMEAGFDDYQRKPLDIRDFVDLVQRRIEAGRRRPA